MFFIVLSAHGLAQNAIDLGLSVKWADRNLGAESIYDTGNPYAFGETKTKNMNEYTMQKWFFYNAMCTEDGIESNYGDAIRMKCFTDKYKRIKRMYTFFKFTYLNVYNLIGSYDAARINWGGKWRMPTEEECKELISKCKFEWTKINGKWYAKVTERYNIEKKKKYKENYIYLPVNDWGDNGYYWTSTAECDTLKNRLLKRHDNSIVTDKTLLFKHPFKLCFFGKKPSDGIADPIITNKSVVFGDAWNGLLIRPVYDESLSDNPVPKPSPIIVTKKNKPIIYWLGNIPQTTQNKTLALSIGIKSESQITNTSVMVNGQLYRGVKSVTNDGYDMKINHTVTLAEGENTIKVSVTNDGGTTTSERRVILQVEKPVITVREKRIALVIGNANYPNQQLLNPVNDATDISNKLKQLGFDVLLVKDGTKQEMENRISEFGKKAMSYDVAMFYYAGHGIQYKGNNYLIPVNANMQSASDVEYECTNVNRVLEKMEESGCKMKIVVLDACRNNPFQRSWYRGTTDVGLSTVNAPVGTFISYSTSPGSVAADGTTRNSPYTTALLQTLDQPGLSIEAVFKNVASKVFQSTNKQQTPWYSSSLFQGEFIFNKK